MTAIAQFVEDEEHVAYIQCLSLIHIYSKEMFEEEGAYYTSHLWITGADEVAFECSFTVKKGEPVAVAEKIMPLVRDRSA